MRSMIFSIVALCFAMIMASCSDAGVNAATAAGDRSSADALGIPAGAVTAEQAEMIAERHVGGTAVKVETEEEDGVQIFEVEVRVESSDTSTNTMIKEVEVRQSDGAVLEVEDEDDDDDDGDGDD